MEQEQLRHQYLDAMGISSWLPCAPLAGAKPSPDWVDDFQYPAPEIPFDSPNRSQQQNVASTAPVSRKSSPETMQQGMSEARAALGLVSEEVNKPASKPVVPIAEGSDVVAEPDEVQTQEQDEAPVFKLVFQRIGSVLIVDSLPPQGGNFANNYQQLAAAIVAALGRSGPAGAAFMLPWPMFASKTLDQGYKQALSAVQHKLSKELQTEEVQTVLLFGEAAAQMVMDRKESLEELKGISFTIKSGVKAIATYSLTEAMQLPGIKRQIWLDLKSSVA
ncbi:hypothetical protein [Neptuniibacter sp. QD57_21]|uniref:hypothetical protein n=1 Tax=Neptuniibacter sp. QD57_21 TaxID=3398213 RepID=UPI0039F4CA7B